MKTLLDIMRSVEDGTKFVIGYCFIEDGEEYFQETANFVQSNTDESFSHNWANANAANLIVDEELTEYDESENCWYVVYKN